MKYFKVKESADQCIIFKRGRNRKLYSYGFLIAGELFTKNELKKLIINPNYLEEVEIKKSRVISSFGSRKEKMYV